MLRHRPLMQRWALWVFAAALLLKAAVPMLASAAADLQGKTLVEVCTVYGVKTVAVDGTASDPSPAGHAAHGGEHCALGGLVAGGALEAPAGVDTRVAIGARTTPPLPVPSESPPPDACAAWVAQLRHGPPSFT